MTVHTVDEMLLENSMQYVATHFESDTGTLTDLSGESNVRDTAISAFVWAESNEWDKAIRAIRSVLGAQVTASDDPLQRGNFLAHTSDTEATDRNWTAFIGSYLLVFRDRYPDHLGHGLDSEILNAIRAAARHRLCIRHELHHTNIILLSTFLLLRAGEVLDDDYLTEAGTRLWTAFYDYTLQNGFGEFNSPNYSKVDLYALGFISDYLENQAVVLEAVGVRNLLWCGITSRYHFATRQLTGPYSRTFTERMAYDLEGVNPFLTRESAGRIPLPQFNNTDQSLHAVLPLLVRASWPAEWVEIATSARNSLQVRERVRVVDELGTTQQIASFLDTDFALGSVNTTSLASTQLRPIIAHLTNRYGDVGVFQMRLDSNPDINGQIWLKSVQNNDHVLFAIYLPSQPKETVSLDINFIWTGTTNAIPALERYSDDTAIHVRMMDHIIALLPWEQSSTKPEVSLDDEAASLTVTWSMEIPGHEGDSPPPLIAAAFALAVDPVDAQPQPVAALSDDELFRLTWQSPNEVLSLSVPANLKLQTAWYIEERIDGSPVGSYPIQENALCFSG